MQKYFLAEQVKFMGCCFWIPSFVHVICIAGIELVCITPCIFFQETTMGYLQIWWSFVSTVGDSCNQLVSRCGEAWIFSMLWAFDFRVFFSLNGRF